MSEQDEEGGRSLSSGYILSGPSTMSDSRHSDCSTVSRHADMCHILMPHTRCDLIVWMTACSLWHQRDAHTNTNTHMHTHILPWGCVLRSLEETWLTSMATWTPTPDPVLWFPHQGPQGYSSIKASCADQQCHSKQDHLFVQICCLNRLFLSFSHHCIYRTRLDITGSELCSESDKKDWGWPNSLLMSVEETT